LSDSVSHLEVSIIFDNHTFIFGIGILNGWGNGLKALSLCETGNLLEEICEGRWHFHALGDAVRKLDFHVETGELVHLNGRGHFV